MDEVEILAESFIKLEDVKEEPDEYTESVGHPTEELEHPIAEFLEPNEVEEEEIKKKDEVHKEVECSMESTELSEAVCMSDQVIDPDQICMPSLKVSGDSMEPFQSACTSVTEVTPILASEEAPSIIADTEIPSASVVLPMASGELHPIVVALSSTPSASGGSRKRKRMTVTTDEAISQSLDMMANSFSVLLAQVQRPQPQPRNQDDMAEKLGDLVKSILLNFHHLPQEQAQRGMSIIYKFCGEFDALIQAAKNR